MKTSTTDHSATLASTISRKLDNLIGCPDFRGLFYPIQIAAAAIGHSADDILALAKTRDDLEVLSGLIRIKE